MIAIIRVEFDNLCAGYRHSATSRYAEFLIFQYIRVVAFVLLYSEASQDRAVKQNRNNTNDYNLNAQ